MLLKKYLFLSEFLCKIKVHDKVSGCIRFYCPDTPGNTVRIIRNTQVRKIAKLDYNAATEAFSEFINDQSLNREQIVFVKKVIDYIVQNGYIENVSELMKPPFDKPQSFVRLFDGAKQKKIVETIAKIKDNAVKVVG